MSIRELKFYKNTLIWFTKRRYYDIMISPFSIIERRDGVVAVRLARGSSYYSFYQMSDYLNLTESFISSSIAIASSSFKSNTFNDISITLPFSTNIICSALACSPSLV
mgnify:CR=1 FL=1